MMKKNLSQIFYRRFLLLLLVVGVPVSFYLFKPQRPQRSTASETEAVPYDSTSTESDLSEVSPEDFQKAFKYQILKAVIKDETPNFTSLRLGLFYLKNEQGKKVSVCEEYPTMDVVFAAEGIAVSGEIPKMIVRGPCYPTPNGKHIGGLPIPWAMILKSPVSQRDFTTSLPGRTDNVRIFILNVVESWPTEWNWIGVKFYGQDPQKTLELNGYEVISVLGQPLMIEAPTTE